MYASDLTFILTYSTEFYAQFYQIEMWRSAHLM